MREILEAETGLNVDIPLNLKYDQRFVRVGQLLGSVGRVVTVHDLLNREENKLLISDEQIIARLTNEPSVHIQSIARRKRFRIE